MKFHLLLFSLFLICSNYTSDAQINFEKGYFINNSDQKVECLIKNNDWHNNPTQFTYKLSEDDEPQKTTIRTVREFGIYNSAKYIRSTVKIDKSSEKFHRLSTSRQPVFKEEQLFLKVLIEGKASLYEYNGDEKRFFYRKGDSPIEQLIFKSYKTSDQKIFHNNTFHQQLWTDLSCPSITLNRVQKLEYKKSRLKRFFTDYNECHNIQYKDYEEKQKKVALGLSIRPRLNYSSLTVENYRTPFRNTDFGSKSNFGLGVEAEFTLPFHKNKWAILIEPTYQKFEAEKTNDTRPVQGRTEIAQVDYKSIEFPVGVRHYFFLSNNSRIFVNASFLLDFSFGSTMAFSRPDGTDLRSIEIGKRNNFAVGTGYRYRNYHVELRYQPSGNILENYSVWNSTYKTGSVILGYSFL